MMMKVGLLVRRALVATATTGALTVAVAPLASADPSPDNETVSNYGHCVARGITDPSEGTEGPLNARLDENGELVYLHLPPGQFKTGGTLTGCIK
jgi:hypothetical protein